jgi:hypothetical protein
MPAPPSSIPISAHNPPLHLITSISPPQHISITGSRPNRICKKNETQNSSSITLTVICPCPIPAHYAVPMAAVLNAGNKAQHLCRRSRAAPPAQLQSAPHLSVPRNLAGAVVVALPWFSTTARLHHHRSLLKAAAN